MKIARRSAAMRPAKPLPTGIRTPASTSSSMPLAARATSSSLASSSSRNAAVSERRISAIRLSSSISSPSSGRYASAASVTRSSAVSASGGGAGGGVTWDSLGVHGFDLRRVLGADRLALELHGRRQLVAARQPIALQQREALDLLDPGELGVGRLDGLLDGRPHALVAGQRGQVGA